MRSEAREREKRDVRDDPRRHRRRVSKKKRRKRCARALREREKREKREKEKRTSGTIDEHLNRSSRPEIGFHHVLQTFRGVDVHEQRRGFVHGLGVWVHRAQRGGHFFLFYVFLFFSRERERERDVARSRERSVKLLELSLVFQTCSFDFFPALSRARRLDDTFYIPTKPTILLLVLLLLLLI